jgi:hypothetical protein
MGCVMSGALAAAYILFVIVASLVVYFRFFDKPLDKTLDRLFAGWHKEEQEEF